MANTKSAAKRARQTERRSLFNRRALTSVKNGLKSARVAVKGDSRDSAKTAAQACISCLDKAVKSGRVHRNAANRHKSAMNKALAKVA